MSVKSEPLVVVFHNQIGSEGTADEVDVLTQVQVVSQALSDLGYHPVAVPLSLDLQAASDRLLTLKPLFVFNLVESIAGTGRFIYFAPALLDRLHMPYTGSGTDAMYLTTNKPLAKMCMSAHQIPTPDWTYADKDPEFAPPYILKPVWEDASVGLSVGSVFDEFDPLKKHLIKNHEHERDWFAEAYIPGREFNISILAENGHEPQVLNVAEIDFVDYPEDKPKIVDYRAKWESDSFEYQHTIRRFDFPGEDEPLLQKLREITQRCWSAFDLRGYARVDFRVDDQGKPWVLEINANPCISPDSGFIAAAEQAGLQFHTVIERIISDIPGQTLRRER